MSDPTATAACQCGDPTAPGVHRRVGAPVEGCSGPIREPATAAYRDYAAEVLAQGKAAPEDQGLYNVIRTSLDYWWDFTTAEAMLRDKGADAYRDGLARRLLCDLRIASERGQIT